MLSIEAYNWSEAYKRTLANRVRQNSAILTNKYWFLPVLDDRSEYVQVGRGDVSSPSCAIYVGIEVCEDVEEHAGLSIDGVDATGKNVVRLVHWFCKNPLCPKCFARGFAVRRARSGEARLEEGVRLGLGNKIEHFTVSPSVEDRALSEAELREKCGRALLARGIDGFCMLFHGRRMNKERTGLVWSPHFHVAGFLRGGYKCRECKAWICMRGSSGDNFDKCDGFEARTRKLNAVDGMIVKCHEERKTVFGTLYYLFNHATVKLSFLKRFHVVTWWGKCSNKQFKSVPLKSKADCRLCGGDMVRRIYVGKRKLVKDIGLVGYKSVLVMEPFDADDGEPNFLDAVGRRDYGSGDRDYGKPNYRNHEE